MKFRSLLLVVVMLASLALSGLVSAQDMGIDLCFGLSEEDCAAIDAASANGIGEATTFTQTQSIEFTLTGLPAPEEAADAPTEISFSQSGSVDIDLNGAGTLLSYNAAASFTLSGSGPEATFSDMLIEIRLIDDVLYVKNLGSLIGDMEIEAEWSSIDLAALMGDPAISAALPTDDTGDLDLEALPVELPDVESLFVLLDIINLPGLIAYERAGDDFVFTVDLTALAALLEEGNEELLDSVVDAVNEINPAGSLFVTVVPVLIQQGTIEVIQTVNTGANIVESLDFNVNFSADLAMFLGTTEPIAGSLAFNSANSNFDNITPIVAPEGAVPFDTSGLTGMLGLLNAMNAADQ